MKWIQKPFPWNLFLFPRGLFVWNRIKGLFGSRGNSHGEQCDGDSEYDFKWHEVGGDNPFGVRVLDVRSLTWHVIATTSDQRIAESYIIQRGSDGREFVSATIPNAKTVKCRLTFPHNGSRLEGIVFKAPSMEVKWDIYIYDSVFLFVRNWTGQLQYRATAFVGEDSITINEIEAPADHIETAPQAVHFLIGTHAMGRVLPHTMPPGTLNEEQQIALLSFSMYGNLGCYATFDDVTKIPIPQPGE